jgi:hypothetical protein
MSSTYSFPVIAIHDDLDDDFSWLQTAAAAFDEKPSTTFIPSIPSPASHISTGSSSSSSSLFHDSHSDSESDDSDSGSDSDPEHLPGDMDYFHHANRHRRVSSRSINPRKRPLPICPELPREQPSAIRAPAPVACFSSDVSSLQQQNKRPRQSPSRNIQTPPDSVSLLTVKANPWECPHCPWVQRNKRTPDLKRHIRTHTRLLHPAQWVCRGVMIEDDTSPHTQSTNPSPYVQKLGAGGCGKTFSRRDALKRHLDNGNIGCAGNLSALTAKQV